jgi:hypothetical protein
MNVRADVAELLRAGYSDRAIGRRLNIDPKKVSDARTTLGLPKARSGKKPTATAEDLFWRRTQPTDDGHLMWTGSRSSSGIPSLRHGGRNLSAYRIAFLIANGREAEGYALPSCGREECVKPGHHADRADRQQEKRVDALYAGIFGPDA